VGGKWLILRQVGLGRTWAASRYENLMFSLFFKIKIVIHLCITRCWNGFFLYVLTVSTIWTFCCKSFVFKISWGSPKR